MTVDGAPETSPDLYSIEAIQDPYPAYASLRRRGDVVREQGIWHVTTYRAADAALRNPRLGRGDYDNLILQALGHGPLYESFRRWMLHLDPPDHTRLRGLVSHAFTPRAIELMRASIAGMVGSLLDGLEARGEGDFIADFAYPLPVQVICELLGVPLEDREEFRTWSTDMGKALQMDTATPAIISQGNAAVDGLDVYFRDLISARRSEPQSSFLDALIAAESSGSRLSDEELLATVVLLFFAGHETTVNLLGNGLYWLQRSPDQWNRLRADPGLVRGAVEEMLRYDTPVQRVTRIALSDVELFGTQVTAGEVLRVLVGSANRDSTHVVDADAVNIERADQKHLAFGSGAHFCLGAYLARAEATIAFGALVKRFPDLEVTESSPTWRPNRLLRGIDELPVRLR